MIGGGIVLARAIVAGVLWTYTRDGGWRAQP